MVERRDKPCLIRQKHAVSKHVARHVAYANGGERLGLDVAVHLAEMALYGFPRALCGNAHLLVVVASRAARGEGIVEPEIMRLADGVRGVGECGRTLVGGNDEIRIVSVAARDIRRRDDAVHIDIVGYRQQAGDEVDVGLPARLEPEVADGSRRQPLRIEPTLGAHRHDDGILHLLSLYQPQHLGAVVLGAVRPAQATPCHRTKAQMYALDFRPIDENLPPRSRFRQALERT